jgi:hypothetical protein
VYVLSSHVISLPGVLVEETKLIIGASMAVDFARYLSRPNRFALVTFLALLLVRIVGVLIESK